MGWSYCGKDREGRDIGYGIEALCDYRNCLTEIDRGLAFVCGSMHGGDGIGCGKYFCYDHLTFITSNLEQRTVQVCEECADICEKELPEIYSGWKVPILQ